MYIYIHSSHLIPRHLLPPPLFLLSLSILCSYRKQAPAWNAVVERFANYSDKVAFGDINLSENRISGAPHNPGAGGWPTIRYFNKDTGYDGKSYAKKTDKSMCDELGDSEYMEAYVTESAGIVGCDVATGEGCSQKEGAFVATWSAKDVVAVSTELARLEKLAADGAAKMKPEAKKWQKSRINLLKSLAAYMAADDSSARQDL